MRNKNGPGRSDPAPGPGDRVFTRFQHSVSPVPSKRNFHFNRTALGRMPLRPRNSPCRRAAGSGPLGRFGDVSSLNLAAVRSRAAAIFPGGK
jgi:hypothetical protein